jgi:hypothetical protein
VGQTPLPSHSLPVPSRSFLPGRVTSTAFGLLLYKHVHIAVLYLRHNGTAERHERLPFMGNSIVSTILPEVFVDPPTYSHDVKAPAVEPADAACTSYLSSGTCLCSGCTCLCSDDLHLFRKERPTCPTLDKVEGGTKTPFSNDQPWLTQSLLFSDRHHAADTRDVHRLSLSFSLPFQPLTASTVLYNPVAFRRNFMSCLLVARILRKMPREWSVVGSLTAGVPAVLGKVGGEDPS